MSYYAPWSTVNTHCPHLTGRRRSLSYLLLWKHALAGRILPSAPLRFPIRIDRPAAVIHRSPTKYRPALYTTYWQHSRPRPSATCRSPTRRACALRSGTGNATSIVEVGRRAEINDRDRFKRHARLQWRGIVCTYVCWTWIWWARHAWLDSCATAINTRTRPPTACFCIVELLDKQMTER